MTISFQSGFGLISHLFKFIRTTQCSPYCRVVCVCVCVNKINTIMIHDSITLLHTCTGRVLCRDNLFLQPLPPTFVMDANNALSTQISK